MNNEATHDEPCVTHEPMPNAYLKAQSVPEPKTTLTMSEARWLQRAILMPLFQLAVQFGVTKPFDYAPPHLMTVAVAYPIAVAWDEDFYPVFKRSTPA